MPVVRMVPKNNEQMVMVRENRDSAGRTDEQIYAMEQNDPKPPRIKGVDALYAEQVRKDQAVYPKVLYKLAVKYKKGADGKLDPASDPIFKGDRINPNYPMPYNLAIENGFQGQVTGHGSDRGVNIVYPYQTCFVPIGWDQQFPVPIDEADCKKDEAKLAKEGWVDHPSKLNLPQRTTDEVD